MASLSMAPVSIFRHGADEEKAETARLSSFVGAIAIGDLVKSTLGPKGMDKILLGGGKGGTVTVTNDGATILKAIGVDNPAAKVLVAGNLCCSYIFIYEELEVLIQMCSIKAED
ncbi:T-complex protein 1 subunit beta [Ilyodon furcidens]|uniref:T-complex protein 1 subunit beta n=1 Tax=Ilyodon furcidens TaxID=33524 RepID=A0ABV0UMG8_9TELE